MNKKIKMYLIILFLILFVGGIGYLVYVNMYFGNDSEELYDHIPEEILPDDELRRTVVNLYFFNLDSGELMQEPQTIDSIELLNNPYQRLIELLLARTY